MVQYPLFEYLHLMLKFINSNWMVVTPYFWNHTKLKSYLEYSYFSFVCDSMAHLRKCNRFEVMYHFLFIWQLDIYTKLWLHIRLFQIKKLKEHYIHNRQRSISVPIHTFTPKCYFDSLISMLCRSALNTSQNVFSLNKWYSLFCEYQ